MDPDKALSLLERAGALGVLGVFVYLLFKGKVVIGWMYDQIKTERDEANKRYLNQVDPPKKTELQ